jgi:DNA repair exonuclease SbcCD nuclease subunit
MKILWIGDMHLRVSDLSDAGEIIDQLLAVIDAEGPEMVVLAGDQFDTFGVVRSEILSHWTRFFVKAAQKSKIVALVGNHDLSGASGGVSAMEPFKTYPNVMIVDSWMQMTVDKGFTGNVQFIPFMRDNAEFHNLCMSLPKDSVLFCHQSFNGAQFDNGFYDPHGAEVSTVEHLYGVISGHVHKSQKIQNILYPGTPRHLTFSDAGETKAVFSISLGNGTYTVDKAHVLDLPQFEVITAGSIDELSAKVAAIVPSQKNHYKLSAKGTPSEIAQFWQSPVVINFKSKVKRVVDALTSMKPITAFIAVKGQTQSEKLDEYIKQRTWRSDSQQLSSRAKQLLTS